MTRASRLRSAHDADDRRRCIRYCTRNHEDDYETRDQTQFGMEGHSNMKIRDLRSIRTLGVTSLAAATFLTFGGVASANETDTATADETDVTVSETTSDGVVNFDQLFEDLDLSIAEISVLESVLDDTNVNVGDVDVDALQDILNDNNVVLTDILNDNNILSGILIGDILGGDILSGNDADVDPSVDAETDTDD